MPPARRCGPARPGTTAWTRPAPGGGPTAWTRPGPHWPPATTGCSSMCWATAPTNPGYLTALAINPRTGRPYTAHDWLADTRELAAVVKAGLSATSKVVGNGLESGTAYFSPAAPTSPLLTSLDGALAESWIRKSGQRVDKFPSLSEWRAAWDMLADAQRTSRMVLVQVKLWTGATSEQVDQWHR